MTKDSRAVLDAIQALAARDLDEASDEKIRAEFIEDGRDPVDVARKVGESLDAVVAQFMRSHAAASKTRVATIQPRPAMKRPTLERMRELIQGAFNREPQLAAAFRDGKKQSEKDIESFYEDLVTMGKIEFDDDDSR